jgi:zinc-finger of transposase IS204/IS1001/IS1096/IS1165
MGDVTERLPLLDPAFARLPVRRAGSSSEDQVQLLAPNYIWFFQLSGEALPISANLLHSTEKNLLEVARNAYNPARNPPRWPRNRRGKRDGRRTSGARDLNDLCSPCPVCSTPSSAMHSHYRRKPADLPCTGHPIRLLLTVRKFFCRNASCPRKIFAERLPELIQPASRLTTRLRAALQTIASHSMVKGELVWHAV